MNKKVEGFAYHKTDKRYVAHFKDGSWQKGTLTDDENVVINESACVLQYAQTCFEGLKAYKTENGNVVCFRPDMNEKRMHDTCLRLMIPPLPDGMFLEAVEAVVAANKDWIPDYESGGALYIRPFIFGSNAVLGVKPATEFEFRVFATPVGSYFSGQTKALKLRTCDFDRAAPHGTGHVKAGLNYAMSLYAIADAHENGFDENLYLDSKTRTYVEETGGANVIFVDKNGTLVTPKSDTILPSITKRSILYIAENYLNIKTEERKVALSELSEFTECGLCGTAAVISPVGSLNDNGKIYNFNPDFSEGSVLHKIFKTLLDIQHEKIEAPANWLMKIK